MDTGLSFAGSYWLRSLGDVSKHRRICGSVPVAHRAAKYSSRNINRPPRRLPSRLNVPAPIHIAKKKSFLSAPNIVRGRDNDRCTMLIRLFSGMTCPPSRGQLSGKEPSKKVHRRDCHANSKKHTGKHAFRAALTKSERQ